MLLNRDPFKLTFKVFTFFGFWDEISTKQRRMTFIVPVASIVIFILLMSLSFLQANTFEDALSALQALPTFTNSLLFMSIILLKKEKIRKLLRIVDEIEMENPVARDYVDRALKLSCKIYKAVGVYSVFGLLSYLLTPIFTGKIVFPMYIPMSFKEKVLTFYSTWIFEIYIGTYITIINYFLYEFRYSLLVMLSQILQSYRLKLRILKAEKNDFENSKKELLACVKLHIQIKE